MEEILKRTLSIVGLLLLLMTGVTCAVNPVTGRQEFSLISEHREIEIGAKSDPDILDKYGYYPDPALQAYVRSIGEPLARLSHRPGLTYHFKVVDSPSINAFALPGGYIYVTRGILSHLNSEAELASVLGHEIGHVTERHAVQQVSAAFGLQLTSLILSSTVEGIQEYSQLTNLLFAGVLSGYGRSKEFSSDRLGQQYMVKAGYDPYATVDVLYTLQRSEGNPLDPVTHWVVSSHPYTADRIQRAARYAQELDPQREALLRNRDRYLARIDGMVYGPGERDGVIIDRRYRNRYFGFECEIPAGWKIGTGRDRWVAEQGEGDLRIQFRLEELSEVMDLDSYAYRVENRIGLKQGQLMNRRRQEGLEILTVRYRAVSSSVPVVVLVGYMMSGRIGAELIGIAPEASERRLAAPWREVLDSMRRLSKSEIIKIPVARIKIHKVRGSETFRSLAQRFLGDPMRAKEIAEINGVDPGTRPTPGTLIKVISKN